MRLPERILEMMTRDESATFWAYIDEQIAKRMDRAGWIREHSFALIQAGTAPQAAVDACILAHDAGL